MYVIFIHSYHVLYLLLIRHNKINKNSLNTRRKNIDFSGTTSIEILIPFFSAYIKR